MKRPQSPESQPTTTRGPLRTRLSTLIVAAAVCVGASGCASLTIPGIGDQAAASSESEPAESTNVEKTTAEEPDENLESEGEDDTVGEEEAAPPVKIAVVDEAASVLAIIDDHPDLETFASLVAGYPQQQVFTQARGVTIFVPNDAAFEAMGTAAVEEMAADSNAFTLFLSAHMAIGTHSLTAVSATGVFTNALAQELPVTRSDGLTTIGSARVEVPDLSATNGVIHIVDGAVTE